MLRWENILVGGTKGAAVSSFLLPLLKGNNIRLFTANCETPEIGLQALY